MNPADFKQIRKSSLQLGQYELAQKLGVSNDTISRFETGRYPIDLRTEYAIKWLEHLSSTKDPLKRPESHSEPEKVETHESCSVDLLLSSESHSEPEKPSRFGGVPSKSKRAKARANRKKKNKKR